MSVSYTHLSKIAHLIYHIPVMADQLIIQIEFHIRSIHDKCQMQPLVFYLGVEFLCKSFFAAPGTGCND